MTDLACVLVVPREQFGKTQESLESLYASLREPVPVVYVDGNAPNPVRRYLRDEAARRGFRLVRVDRYLTSNEARNIALRHAPRTKYVAFVDNDVLFRPGWLEELTRCAEETGAPVVGPLYLIGNAKRAVVHMAGGELRIDERDGERALYEHHRFSGRPIDDVSDLVRHATGVVEFHCMLVERRFLDELGPFDEELLSFLDHVDFCLAATLRGRSVMLEPRAVVTHLVPPPIARGDLPYFALRWSDAWMQRSFAHFAAKHRLTEYAGTYGAHTRFRDLHREALATAWLRRMRLWRLAPLGRVGTRLLCNTVLETTVVRRLERQRLSAIGRANGG